MVTNKIGRPRKGAAKKQHGPKVVFLGEVMDSMGRTDEWLADQMGVARETVNRWRNHPTRLHPLKLHQIAKKLGIETVELLRDPARGPSIDSLLREQPPEVQERAVKMVKALIE